MPGGRAFIFLVLETFRQLMNMHFKECAIQFGAEAEAAFLSGTPLPGASHVCTPSAHTIETSIS